MAVFNKKQQQASDPESSIIRDTNSVMNDAHGADRAPTPRPPIMQSDGTQATTSIPNTRNEARDRSDSPILVLFHQQTF